MTDALGFSPDPEIRCRDFKIGCIGAGFIMADVHLASYHEAGFPVVAIASRTKAKAADVAKRWNIGTVHDTPETLIEDPRVEILDIAYPPDQQPDLIRHALKQKHIKAILAQKPLAMTFEEAKRIAAECKAAGKVLSVNQNMRFDQSMRVLKQILDKGSLGTPVLATIEMRAIPHWQPFLHEYDRLTLLNMSIHHLDVLRFLFGDPSDIYTAVRSDPRTTFPHRDGITVSTMTFPSGLMAVSMEDVWSGPREEGYESDIYIKWRVEGTEGVAQGTIGWPDYPKGSPSTLRYCSKKATGGKWVQPTWSTMWFPNAFKGVMEQLQYALKTNTRPLLEGQDNVKTMALIEAGYRSMAERRAVRLDEFHI
ncbi:oxidoreductase [Hypericibacter terrae]|uniref:Oxidoreductase n=1 Tax=Hypericibacter terrae TaxID=2602015 RepID=A0A5J6MGE2_9PROT|nr:Gfo/Idh/MocA family oxidoreductase [Hypericibacter terrae]QEX16564.1 oxidoreductase [Hypericibacter terrae]